MVRQGRTGSASQSKSEKMKALPVFVQTALAPHPGYNVLDLWIPFPKSIQIKLRNQSDPSGGKRDWSYTGTARPFPVSPKVCQKTDLTGEPEQQKRCPKSSVF